MKQALKNLRADYMIVSNATRDGGMTDHIQFIGSGRTLCGLVDLKPIIGRTWVSCGTCERAYRKAVAKP